MSEEIPKELSAEDQAVLKRLRETAEQIGLDPAKVHDCLDLQTGSGEVTCPVCNAQVGNKKSTGYSQHFVEAHPDLTFGQKSN